jgi:hypothetical protein
MNFTKKIQTFSKTRKIIFMFLPISLTLRAPHVSFHVSCLGKHAAEANHQSQRVKTRGGMRRTEQKQATTHERT